MTSEDQPTCGKGLAANAVLPEHLGHLMHAMADVLEAHVQTLDLDDENARRERAAYTSLIEQHRHIATQLADTAREMVGYRDLPMGRHHMEAMAQQVEPFKTFVRQKRDLLSLLQEMDNEDRAMLEEFET